MNRDSRGRQLCSYLSVPIVTRFKSTVKLEGYLLGFDASKDFHVYGFKWTGDGIEWYVDGTLAYSVEDSPDNPTPKATDSLQKIMMNLWPVDESAADWAGEFDARTLTLSEITFIGVYTYTDADLRGSLAALCDGRLGMLDWIERRPLSEGGRAFHDLDAGRTPAAKIILTP